MTVYVSIGNSDDKLTQREWHHYAETVESEIFTWADQSHGVWLSEPRSPYQNACWCFEISPEDALWLKSQLRQLAALYRQDSIAWAEAETEFLRGGI